MSISLKRSKNKGSVKVHKRSGRMTETGQFIDLFANFSPEIRQKNRRNTEVVRNKKMNLQRFYWYSQPSFSYVTYGEQE